MAWSGTIDMGSSKAWSGYIYWEVTSQGSNYSNLRATVYTKKTDGYKTSGNTYFQGSLYVAGKTGNFSYAQEETSDSWRYSIDATVNHDGNGDASAWIEASVSGPSGCSLSGVTLSGEGRAYLPHITQYYTISYNANGGSGAPGNQTKTEGVNLALSSTVPSKPGYDFLGWSTSSTATTATWGAGGTYTSNSSATLYAVWRIKTYTVSYDANGGSNAPGNQTKTHGVNLTLSSSKPTRTGYNFSRWNTNSAGTGTNYYPGGTYTANASVTLYAIWTAITYTVSYDANGGSGAPGNQTKTYGVNLTLTSAKPSRTGYTFARWNTAAAGNGTNYYSGGTYSGNAALKLYAIWTANSYSIKFNANGGTGTMADQGMTYGTAANLKSNAFTRAGHSFLGWATSSAGGVVYKNGASVSNLVSTAGGSITLYAVWSINAITITFDAATNGGTSEETSRNINYGYAIGNLPTATRPYYKFSGWFTEPSGGTKVTAATTFTASATLYAQFAIDASTKVKISGQWEPGIPYVKVNGVWRKGYAWVKAKGSWKQGIG